MGRQVLSIQVLRGVAAMAVVLGHASLETNFVVGQVVMPYALRYGAVGVDLFFVISGFVMVYSSERLFAAPGGSIHFAARRLIRIVPLYWLMTTVLVLQWWRLGVWTMSTECVAASYFFVPCAGDGTHIPALGAGWTLTYEMFFYALFTFAVMLPRRQAVLAVIATLVVFTATRGLWPVSLLNYWAARPVDGEFHGVVLEFAMGAAIALAYREGMRVPRGAALAMLAAGVIGFVVASGFDLHTRSEPTFWGVPCALVVAGSVFAGDPQRPGRSWRAMLALGDASYSLYLTHVVLNFTVRTDAEPVAKALAQISPWLYASVLVVLAIVVSLLIYRLIERPMTEALRSRLERFYDSRPRRVTAPVAATSAAPQVAAE